MKSKAIEAPKNEFDKRTDAINALLPKARTDAKAAAQFWELLKEDGGTDRFLRGSDMAFQTELALNKNACGDEILSRQMNEKRLALMRRELDGDNPTPLETLLVQRIALCWLHLHTCETAVVQSAGKLSLAQAAYQQKRLDSAHKRYLSAIKALAQVRKLQLPNVQVNIGEKQVNIGQVNGAAK